MSKYQRGLEVIGFVIALLLSLYLYLEVSRTWAIIIVVAVAAILGLSLILLSPGTLVKLKYARLLRFLQKYPYIDEDTVEEKSNLPKGYLHKGFYELSKTWVFRPLVVFSKRQYLYLGPAVVDFVLECIVRNTIGNDVKFPEVYRELGLKFAKQKRADLEIIVGQLLKNIP